MHESQASNPLRQKLGYYAMGVAVGFCLLGVIWANRARVQREQEAARRAAEAAEAADRAGAPAVPSGSAPHAPVER